MAGRLRAGTLIVVWTLLSLSVEATSQRAGDRDPSTAFCELAGKTATTPGLVATEAPAWSADGNCLLVPAKKRESGVQHLLLAKRAGLLLVVNRDFTVCQALRSIQWSEEFGQAVFHTSNGRGVVTALDLQTGETQPLATGARPVVGSGGRIVFARGDQDELSVNIYSLDVRAKKVSKLTSHLLARDWCISPDGKRVAVRYSTLDATGPRGLARPLAVVSVASPLAVKSIDPGVGYGDFGMAWRSNDTLLFGVVVENGGRRRFEVVQFDVSRQARRVVLESRELGWYTGRPWWSTTGEYVVYPSAVRSKDGRLRENWRALRRLNTATGAITELSFPVELRAQLSLSPDGQLVAAISEAGDLWLGDFASRQTTKAVLQTGCRGQEPVKPA